MGQHNTPRARSVRARKSIIENMIATDGLTYEDVAKQFKQESVKAMMAIHLLQEGYSWSETKMAIDVSDRFNRQSVYNLLKK